MVKSHVNYELIINQPGVSISQNRVLAREPQGTWHASCRLSFQPRLSGEMRPIFEKLDDLGLQLEVNYDVLFHIIPA